MIKNTEQSYGLIAIILHWVMAIVIFGLFGLGLYMVELSYYDAWYKGSLDLHKSIGSLLAILLLIRVFWRTVNLQPEHADSSAASIEVKAAYFGHLALYILMFLLMLSGYLISTADGRAIEVFNVFSLPALPFSIDNQEDIFGEIHFYLAWTLIVLATGHGFAALKHHFINKNNTLKRMLFVSK
ncbi:cytochrome b [Litorilituus lipolyticus]|uniref:Cytochrome b n=1 Tax=Litorilituus lipolyticus TaxID=2491017 RepID=A0A502KSA1_9GAMM|nr:cytochrome b [Litorilituus lipolyticus]TPH12493.1 cytochrome b [Litorilituus lipolyticus]